MPNKICYWDGCLDPTELLSDVNPKIIEQLKNGEYQSADLDTKKLPGYRIYSLRLNDSDRLLFTTVVIDGQACLLLLERIWNHDYQKSRFLKPGVLANYLEKNAQVFKQAVVDKDSFQAAEFPQTDAVPASASNDDTFHRLEFYQNTFIELSPYQQQAKQLSLPLVISGAAGSGKSCVAVSRLREFIEQHPQAASQGVLYLTQSEPLVETMQSLWKQLPVLQNNVAFLTYESLLSQLSDEAGELKFVQSSDFYAWLTKYITIYKRIAKTNPSSTVSDAFLNAPERMYQEMRILSAYEQKDYLALGKHQSLYRARFERQWLWDAYQRYTRYLEINHLINPAFQAIKNKARFGFIVVDEAQDLSHLQLSSLFDLATAHAICYCIDTHQSLADNQSKRPFLLNLGNQAQQVNYYELPQTHRCPEYVTQLANEVLRIKRLLIGGTGDKQEQLALQHAMKDDNHKGDVQWIEKPSRSELSYLRREAASSQFAVITLPEHIEEAKALFQTPMVFTISEVKGLEFLDVLVYRPLDNKLYQQANQHFKQLDIDAAENKHRPKAHRGQDQFSVPMNGLFTAITRTKNRLIVCQEKRRAVAELVSQLQKALPVNQSALLKENESHDPGYNTEKDWLEAAEKLWALDKKSQALGIMTDKLNYSRAQAEARLSEKPLQDSDCADAAKPHGIPASDEHAMPNRQRTAVNHRKEKIQATKKQTQSPPQKVTEKTAVRNKSQAYIAGLLGTFTENNLITCLKHPKATIFLYDIVYEGRNLLSHILDCESHLYLLIKVLIGPFNENKKVLSFFSVERLLMKDEATQRPYMASFFKSIANLTSFCIYMRKNPAILRQLSSQTRAEMLEVFFQSKALVTETLPDIVEMNLAGFLGILAVFPEISQAFTPELLLASVNVPLKNVMQGKVSADILQKISQYEQGINTDFLSWLAGDEYGRRILKILLDQNPDLAKQLPMKAWISTHQNVYGINTFPLLCLCSSIDGVYILNRLYQLNPELILSVPMHAWALNRSTISYKTLSSFAYLAGFDGGFHFMKELFYTKPELARELPVDAWRGGAEDISEQDITDSLFYNLATSPHRSQGIDLIIQLVRLNPQLIECLPFAIWEKSISKNKMMPFLLVFHPEGHEMMLQSIKAQPELVELFFPYLSNAINKDNLSAFLCLTRTPDGHKILQIIIDRSIQFKKFDYREMINAEQLTSISTSEGTVCVHCFPLFLLAAQPSGLALLKNIFAKEPSLIRQIPTEFWFKRLSHFEGMFPLYLLFYFGGSGFLIFKQLIKDNPEVVLKLTQEHLLHVFPQPLDKNSSFLTLLILYAEGQKHLATMMKINLPLFLSISVDKWETLLLHTAIINKSGLNRLCQTKAGQKVLFELLSKMPSLKTEVASAFVTVKADNLDADLDIFSAFGILAKSQTGKKILSFIGLSNDRVAVPQAGHGLRDNSLFAARQESNTADHAPAPPMSNKR